MTADLEVFERPRRLIGLQWRLLCEHHTGPARLKNTLTRCIAPLPLNNALHDPALDVSLAALGKLQSSP